MEQVRRRLLREWPERELLTGPKGEGAAPKPAAVLVPLYVRERELFTLFTRRSDTVEHHKGQISFPGGVKEPGDANLWTTAIREAEEEVGIPRASVRLLGALPRLVTVTDFEVSPFVGAVPYPTPFAPHREEVEQILEIPVSYLLDPRAVEERPVRWNGRDVMTLVYHYQGHTVWGATARILADLLEALSGDAPAARPS